MPITSCLVESRRGMKRAMLEVVASGVVTSSQDVERYLKCRWGTASCATAQVLSVTETLGLQCGVIRVCCSH